MQETMQEGILPIELVVAVSLLVWRASFSKYTCLFCTGIQPEVCVLFYKTSTAIFWPLQTYLLCFIYDSPSGRSIWTYWAALMHYKKVAAETEYYVSSFQ